MLTVYPKFISVKYWAATVIADYSDEPLPILKNEEDWAKWGAVVADTGAFKRAHIPSPLSVKNTTKESNFKDWESWAKVVYNIMRSEITDTEL